MRLKGRRRVAIRGVDIWRRPRWIHGGWRERMRDENRNQSCSRRSYMSDGIAKRLSVPATVAQSDNALYALIVYRRGGGGRLECG